MKGSTWSDRLAWVERHSPLTQRALARFPLQPQLGVFLCFHIDLKMVPVLSSLANKVRLAVLPCNPATVDPDGWEYLKTHSRCQLWTSEQAEQEWCSRDHDWPYLCDLGGEWICRALAEKRSDVRGALEGTSSGVLRIRSFLDGESPSFPVLDWNSAPLKVSIHNEKMVGFSLWQTFTEVTRLSLHGKRVGLLGFGPVGLGIARTARSLGGAVTVFDPSAGARTLAAYEGFPVLTREQVLRNSDILVTATGRPDALRLEDLRDAFSGVFVVNAGHSSDEIHESIREHPERRSVLHQVEEFPTQQGTAYLLARGELLNLKAGFGDSINAFDLTSAQLIEALSYLVTTSSSLGAGWHNLPSRFSNDVLKDL